MDKNMINIDDLVRQRLSGGEEEERAGAWLRMRELLDKEEPVRVAAGYNWKRMLTYAGGLLLLATATIGGYQAYQSLNDSKQAAGDAAFVANNNNSNRGLLSGVSLNDAAASSMPVSSATNTQPAEKQQQTATINTKVEKQQQTATKSTVDGVSLHATKAEKLIAGNNTPSITNNNNLQPQRNNDAVTATNSNKPTQETNKEQNNTITNSNKPNSLNNTTTIATATKQTTTTQEATSLATNKQDAMTTTPNRSFASGGNTQQPARVQLPPEVTNPRYIKENKKVDSINMIATKESNRKGIRKVDTVAMGKLATEKYVGSDATLAAAPATTEIAPAAAAPSDNKQEGQVVALADKKISSKNYKNKNYNPRRFEQMVENAKMNLSGVTFHPGLMMGVNSTLGSYNMMGMNLGAVVMMDINERWGMFAELKYTHRFGNGKSLHNNYNKISNTNYLGNNMYEHLWDSVEHSFNITSSSAVELPIALRYSVKRVNVFVGINTAYNFAVKVDEKENPHPRKYVTNTGSSTQLTSQWGDDNRKLVYDDFNSRFTMGYLLGVGYQLSPATNFDLRLSQPIWDNVKTKGAYIVSKELFRTPSVQLNMTYRFSNNKYKPRTREY